jgi:chromosome segregation ATPase
MTQNNNKIDKFKIASEIFYDFKSSLAQVLRENPEIVEEAIRKRNTIIKCLKAEIEHRIVVYRETVTRYEEMADELENFKSANSVLKQALDKTVQDKEKYELSSTSSHKLFITKQEDFVRLKREKDKLEKELEEIQEELNKTKTHIAVELVEKKKALQYRLSQTIDKLPNGFVKLTFKFLLSKYTFKYTVFFLFCVLVIASITGWPAILGVVKSIISIFGI